MTRARIIAVVALLITTLSATDAATQCRHFAIWKYPWRQPCSTGKAGAGSVHAPPASALDRTWTLEIAKATPDDKTKRPPDQMALPKLEDMTFPPEPDDERHQRLKGIGLLREYYGTN